MNRKYVSVFEIQDHQMLLPHHTLYSVWYVCVHVHACVLCVQVYMHILISMCRAHMSTSVVSLDFLLT